MAIPDPSLVSPPAPHATYIDAAASMPLVGAALVVRISVATLKRADLFGRQAVPIKLPSHWPPSWRLAMITARARH